MATINASDVLTSIVGYIENNARPCPAHYLTQKFGDDVVEAIAALKKEGKVLGRRGRNGGIVLPDTVLPSKSASVDTGTTESTSDTVSVPF